MGSLLRLQHVHRVRIEAQAALLADGVNALVLGVILRQLHERVADHDVIVLVGAHEAAEHHAAGQAALFAERGGFRAQNQSVFVSGFQLALRREADILRMDGKA